MALINNHCAKRCTRPMRSQYWVMWHCVSQSEARVEMHSAKINQTFHSVINDQNIKVVLQGLCIRIFEAAECTLNCSYVVCRSAWMATFPAHCLSFDPGLWTTIRIWNVKQGIIWFRMLSRRIHGGFMFIVS